MVRWVALVGLVGCADSGFATITPGAPLVGASSRLDGVLVIAVAPSDHASLLPQIATDAPPTGFRWLKLAIATEVEPAIYSGYTADLASPAAGVTFTQTFADHCNPRTNDYNACWYMESLASGAAGVSGTIQIDASPTTVTTSIEVVFEGMTTQWGEPAVYYKHNTSSGFTVDLAIAPSP